MYKPLVVILPLNVVSTVESRYLELEYVKVCETRSVNLNQKYILIAFSNHKLALEINELICTSGNLNLQNIVPSTSKYRESTVF